MANYNSRFNINEAFEDFKNKQETKSRQGNNELKQSRFTKSQINLQANEKTNKNVKAKGFNHQEFENLFLSSDKMTSTFNGTSTNLKIKVKNAKDHTPVNIFQSYLKTSATAIVSPIPIDNHLGTDFCDENTV